MKTRRRTGIAEKIERFTSIRPEKEHIDKVKNQADVRKVETCKHLDGVFISKLPIAEVKEMREHCPKRTRSKTATCINTMGAYGIGKEHPPEKWQSADDALSRRNIRKGCTCVGNERVK